jgi:hypothetical protein
MNCVLNRFCKFDADYGDKVPEIAILLQRLGQESKATALRTMRQERMGSRAGE